MAERESEVAQSCPTLCDPVDCSPPAPLSMGFSRREYWSGLPFPSPGDLPDPGTEPKSPALQADALTSEPPGKPMASHCLMAGMNLDIFYLDYQGNAQFAHRVFKNA